MELLFKNKIKKKKDINVYQIKQNFIYQEIILINALNHIRNLRATENRLDHYLYINKKQIEKHFDSKSLIPIFLYFQYSKIGYGSFN